MLYMNDYDIAQAARRFETTPEPRRRRRDHRPAPHLGQPELGRLGLLARTVQGRQDPMGLVASTTNALNDAMVAKDATPTVVRRAASPVKAFCTRAQRAGIMTAGDCSHILAPLDLVA